MVKTSVMWLLPVTYRRHHIMDDHRMKDYLWEIYDR